MKPKEIHDLLLSFLVRGLGFWLLYQALPSANYYDLGQDILVTIGDKGAKNQADWWDVLYLLEQLLPAIYFILGAPPLLKWATRKRD